MDPPSGAAVTLAGSSQPPVETGDWLGEAGGNQGHQEGLFFFITLIEALILSLIRIAHLSLYKAVCSAHYALVCISA